MKVTLGTRKGTSEKINTDSLLFVSETTTDNPVIIDGQNEYSHYLDFDNSFIGVIADAMTDESEAHLASKIVTEKYLNYFTNLLNSINEQEVIYTLMDIFVRIELDIAVFTNKTKQYTDAAVCLAGIFNHKKIGTFIFNAGDTRVYEKDKNISVLTLDHINGNVVKNCAGGGGSHYLSVTGSIRKKPDYYLIATSNFYDFLETKDIEKMFEDGSENIIKKTNDFMQKTQNKQSYIHISLS